jgi:DNA-binding protein H-NS
MRRGYDQEEWVLQRLRACLAERGVSDLDRECFERWRCTISHLHPNSRHTYERIEYIYTRSPFNRAGFCLYSHRFRTTGGTEMAKAVRGRARKTAARKPPVPVKRKAATTRLTSDKFKALVDNLTTTELDELIKAATGRKNEEIAGARASFLDEVKARAASLGMSLADLVGLGNGKTAKSRAARTAPTPKYRNPDTGETWSGRGRPAKWLTDHEAKGRKREEFAI